MPHHPDARRFAGKVKRTIEQLQHGDLQAMATRITRKRTAWLDRNFSKKTGHGKFSPRAAFELLFLKQMGLRRDDLPAIAESEREIVWLSRNPCQLLEACNALGRETRTVCRSVNEKATQAFLSRIDPRLRFHRSYTEIRPYADHCRERIVRIDFESYMRTALEEAVISRTEGNKGYGAVIVLDDRIIARAHDTAVTERDPSLHAEVNAVRQAVKATGDGDLCGAVLFSTCEPCPMCSSLAVWANLTTIVYGISIAETSRMGRKRIRIDAARIIGKSPCVVEVIGNVLHDECRMLYAMKSHHPRPET